MAGKEVPMYQRWCIYIDILGFSKVWECDEYKALKSLRELMRAIYRIGKKVYPNEVERLFVHQMGDGFAIVSNFGEDTLERPITIAIALMRHVASTGMFATAAIAEGEFSDITGCYPREVTDELHENTVKLGEGLMTLSAVMGTAFIRAYSLHERPDSSGSFLLVPNDYSRIRIADLPVKTINENSQGTQLLSIDWVRARMQTLSNIQAQACLVSPTSNELVQKIKEYCAYYPDIGKKWSRDLHALLDIRVE